MTHRTPREAIRSVSYFPRVSEGQGGTEVVRELQYEVREGREAGEVVVIPKAFIANRNGSFILQLEMFDEISIQFGADCGSEA